MRFSGDLTAWTRGRTPGDVAAVRARAEQIARDYFGTHFPAIPW
jgi:cytochrome c556